MTLCVIRFVGVLFRHLLHYLADRFAELGPVQFAGCTAQQYSVSVGSMVLPGEVSIAEMVQTSTERLVVHYSQRTEAS